MAGQISPNRRVKRISPGPPQGARYAGAGRDFTWEDVRDHRSVALVSENMARENWGGLPTRSVSGFGRAAPGSKLWA